MRGATPEGIEIAKTKGVHRGRARKLTLEPVPGARCRVEVGVGVQVARDLGCFRRALYDAITAQGAYATATAGGPATTDGAHEC